MSVEEKMVLYLRTDPTYQKIVAGGSVAHTLGVIKGLLAQKHKVICGMAFMADEVEKLSVTSVVRLKVSALFFRMGWRLACFASNLLYLLQLRTMLRREKISFVYQRYRK